MAQVLGIIGGGQLGMMLTEAAADMDHIDKVIVLDPTPDCPAAQVGAAQIVGNFDDADAIRKLASESDIITYEIESGNSNTLESLTDSVEINPSPGTLRIIQDKLSQKQFLREHDLPVPDFVEVSTKDDIKKGAECFGYPVLLKARTGGYDGRGNRVIHGTDDIDDALKGLAGPPLMLEKFVPYVMEISVIVARNTAGDIAAYPAVENIHHANILRQTISPARISSRLAKKAGQIAMETIRVLQGAGVFGIEMFLLRDDTILINEIAPRVHNSGHHTLESCKTSQFRQHLLAILGQKLEDTTPQSMAIMYNILGPEDYTGPYRPPPVSHHSAVLKMYGKHISKPLRKLGHLNLIAKHEQGIDDLLTILDTIKEDTNILHG